MNKYTNYPSLCDIIKDYNIIKMNAFIDIVNNNTQCIYCNCFNSSEILISIDDDRVCIYRYYYAIKNCETITLLKLAKYYFFYNIDVINKINDAFAKCLKD